MKITNSGKLQTLHTHTNNSDGVLTHRQVLDVCNENGIGVVAFTDHDTLPNRKQVKELESLKNHPTKYVIGIEVTSGYPLELSNKDDHMFHIVGLFVDPFNKPLVALTKETHRVRIERLEQKVKEFNKMGFKVNVQEVKNTVTSNGIPTSLNLVNVLINHPENKKVIEKYVKKMDLLSKGDEKVAVLYNEMITDVRGDKQKYFNTFMKDESPLKIDLPEQKKMDMDSVVRLIRGAGGLATLAHWSFERENVSGKLLEILAKEKRLDGVETVYDLFLYDNPLWENKMQKDIKFLKTIAKKYGLFTSGGVDAHKKDDFALFAGRSNYNRNTIGMVEKIIETKKPNTNFSSINL